MLLGPSWRSWWWCFLCCRLADAKGSCANYFGGAVQDPTVLTTVIDPDVFSGFPFGNLTFIHHSGPDSQCISPGPPRGCHRYFVASYGTARSCEAVAPGCALVGADRAAALAGTMDGADLFDRGTGVLKSCAACLQGVDVRCWHAPATEPVRCNCPGTATAVEDTAPSTAAVVGATVAACAALAGVFSAASKRRAAAARGTGLLQ